jgi:hypothetical protein
MDMCQLKWAVGYPDILSNIILGVWDERNTYKSADWTKKTSISNVVDLIDQLKPELSKKADLPYLHSQVRENYS